MLHKLPRPLGYVLPGGGALAAYQVGVLDALTAVGVQPDRLIGVSGGAMNAALFWWSSGLDDVSRLERIWTNVRRRDLLRVHPGRFALALAGKRRSFVDNRHGIAFLRTHLGARRIEHAPIPLTIIATDLATGRPFIFESGDVVSAIVASSAFPGVFPPVEGRRPHPDRRRRRRRRTARCRRRLGNRQCDRHCGASAGAGARPAPSPRCRPALFDV